MQVTVSAATFLAWVSAVVAQTAGFDAVLTPTKNEVVEAGSTYTITWDYSSTYSSTVSIQILQGASSTTLQLGDVIASKSCPHVSNLGDSLSLTEISQLTQPPQPASTTLWPSTPGPSTPPSEMTPPTA